MEPDNKKDSPLKAGILSRIGWASALIGLLLLQGWFLISWFKTDTRPLAWDESIHAQLAFDFMDRFSSEGLKGFFKPAYFNYPPLYHITLGLAVNRVKDVTHSGPLVNYFYLVMLVLSVFLIADLLMGKWAAFTSAFLVSSYPIVIYISHYPMVDLALTAWVTLGFYFLIKSEDFKNPRWSILFGLALGLGMLTKWTALAYLLGPLLWSMGRAFLKKRVKWFFLSMFLFGIVSLPWYIYNFIPVTLRIIKLCSLPSAGGVTLGMLNWMWYPLALLEQMNLFFVLLFIPGLIVAFFKPKARPVLLWFLVSEGLFSLIRNHNSRYTMPVLPAAAILSVMWLPKDRKSIFIGLNTLILAVLILFQLNIPVMGRAGVWKNSFQLFPLYPPIREDWKHSEIIQKIQDLRDKKSPFSKIVTVSNAPYFHSTTLNASCRAKPIPALNFEGPSKTRWLEFTEFILVKTGDLGPGFTLGTVGACAKFLADPPDWFGQVFKEKGRWPLPDGSSAILYQREPKPIHTVAFDFFNFSMGEMVFDNIDAKDVEIKANLSSKGEFALGKIKKLIIRSGNVEYKDLNFIDVSVKLINPQINIPLFLEDQQLQFLNLETLKLNAKIPTQSFLKYARDNLAWLKDPTMELRDSDISVKGVAFGVPVQVDLSILVQNSLIKTALRKIRIFNSPFPTIFFRSYADRSAPLKRNPDMPFNLDISSIIGEGDGLRISSQEVHD